MKYRTIVADPPWHYDGFPSSRGRGGYLAGRPERVPVERHPWPYPTMTVSQIRDLPIGDMAERDAWLFLWTTDRYLRDAFAIIDDWRFTFVQLVTWHKTSNASPFAGSIAWRRSEHLLACRRGAAKVRARWPSTVIAADKPHAEHSRKPDVFLDLIESGTSGPYLELFARRQRLGWDTWGNEALEHVQLGAEGVT